MRNIEICVGEKVRYTLLNILVPNNKILHWSKLKGYADNKRNVRGKLKFVLERVENIVGKDENVGYHHFLLFPQCFQKLSFSGLLKVGIVWYRVKQSCLALLNEIQYNM